MVKPLTFKGDKKAKKRKRADPQPDTSLDTAEPNTSTALTTTASRDAEAEDENNDDSWVTADAVSDIGGPVLLVLPTTPPTCLACDANGSIFSSPLENMVEADPASAEPHDVRQVWVATRVAGTQGLSLRGHHGKYLSAARSGALSATRDAISPEESFLPLPAPSFPGAFALQSARDKFIAAYEEEDNAGSPQIRADAESIEFRSTLRVRMQARFKPRERVKKEERARAKIGRKELEEMVGRRLEEDEVRMLKKARREGDFHEKILDVKVKGKHDKFA